MLLLLIRHAVALPHDATVWPDDRERPLSPRGKQEFKRVARGVASLLPSVDLVLSSPLRRTWQTAEILSKQAGWPAPRPLAELEPGRTPEDLVLALRRQPGAESLALVGHQPGLERGASYLLTGSAHQVRLTFKKGSVACLETEGLPGAGAAALRWLLAPAQLRAL